MLLTKIWVPLVALLTWCADATEHGRQAPIARVTQMLEGMVAKIQLQGKLEQASYDKYSCWCEETLAKTADDISKAKQSIEDLQNGIMQLQGDLGSISAQVKQLNTDISENQEAQKESVAVREKEHADFESEKTEAEQCIGALETSIKVLSNGKKFLQSGAHAGGAYEEAQIMSVAADVQGVLKRPGTSQLMSESDLKVVRAFVSNPAGEFSAIQMGQSQNPFGDYAPQSTQIQGILKSLYDSFVDSLKKSTADESRSQKAFEDLMATKKQEAKTLQASLDKQELDFAEKKKKLADSKEQMDDTKADLEVDESLFTETGKDCSAKAAEWSQRTKLRTLELSGINKAIEILSSKEANEAFKGAAGSFMQLVRIQHHAARLRSNSLADRSAALRHRAYAKLRALAAKTGSVETARIAVEVKSGSAFDKVIMMVDMMIEQLRKEEQEDIQHRDRCQNSENKNSNEKEDLGHLGATLEDEIARLQDTAKAKKQDLEANKKASQDIKKEMEERLKLRNEEHDEFVRALEADIKAVEIIATAKEALAKFYAKQGSASSLSQTAADLATDRAPPEVSWGKEGGEYGGQKGMNQNAITALDVIKEDLQKEIDSAKAENAENEASYEKDVALMEKALKAKKDTIEAIENQLAEMGVHLEDKQAALSQNGEDVKEAEEMTKALETDCTWVKTHFDKRRKARKAEIKGLQEAKDHLAKASTGAEDDELDLDDA